MVKRILGLMLLLAGSNGVFAQQAGKNLNIVFIGNSITQGAGLQHPATEAPPVHAAAWLRQQRGIGRVAFLNRGRSGFTTVDFLPATNKAFPEVLAAADTFAGDSSALLVFSIILGTNDSAIEGTNGAPVAPAAYRANLRAIADRLLAAYPRCRIVFHFPLWYSPNTYNGARYLQEGLNRLQSYFPEIDALVAAYKASAPGRVFSGDRQAFGYFKQHHSAYFQHENGRQGIFYLHPNAEGAKVLGEMWGKAILRALR